MLNHEAAQLLGGLCAAFPSAKFPPETQHLYLASLERLPYESTRDAVDELIGTTHRMPVIAQIREAQQRHQARHIERDRQRQTTIPDQRPDDVPYTNADRRRDAVMLADEAVAIRMRGGAPYWADYLARMAELYAENANRVDRGQAPLKHFRVSELVKPLTGRLVATPQEDSHA